MKLKLNCLSVRTRRQLARWAIVAFELPRSPNDLPLTEINGLFGWNIVVDVDRIGGEIYALVGQSGTGRDVKLLFPWAASRELRRVLDSWRHDFVAGLSHDYGICISFEA